MMVGYAHRVTELAQLRVTRARIDARETVLLAELAAQPDPFDKQWVREEVACALRISPSAARDRLGMSALTAASICCRRATPPPNCARY